MSKENKNPNLKEALKIANHHKLTATHNEISANSKTSLDAIWGRDSMTEVIIAASEDRKANYFKPAIQNPQDQQGTRIPVNKANQTFASRKTEVAALFQNPNSKQNSKNQGRS